MAYQQVTNDISLRIIFQYLRKVVTTHKPSHIIEPEAFAHKGKLFQLSV